MSRKSALLFFGIKSAIYLSAVPQEVRANYTTIIDAILAESDLSQITPKTIREGIQAKVEYDITPQKVRLARKLRVRLQFG